MGQAWRRATVVRPAACRRPVARRGCGLRQCPRGHHAAAWGGGAGAVGGAQGPNAPPSGGAASRGADGAAHSDGHRPAPPVAPRTSPTITNARVATSLRKKQQERSQRSGAAWTSLHGRQQDVGRPPPAVDRRTCTCASRAVRGRERLRVARVHAAKPAGPAGGAHRARRWLRSLSHTGWPRGRGRAPRPGRGGAPISATC